MSPRDFFLWALAIFLLSVSCPFISPTLSMRGTFRRHVRCHTFGPTDLFTSSASFPSDSDVSASPWLWPACACVPRRSLIKQNLSPALSKGNDLPALTNTPTSAHPSRFYSQTCANQSAQLAPTNKSSLLSSLFFPSADCTGLKFGRNLVLTYKIYFKMLH